MERSTTLLLCAIGVGCAGLMMSCSREAPSGGGIEAAGPSLPDGALGWQAVDDGTTYDTETIYAYIDGHAEVYMAYGMVRCLSRRYSGPEGEPDIVLDLFEQATPADAFGVFTHDRDGDLVSIGTDALFRYGWLSFWKGPFFVSVYAEEDTEASRAAVLELGRAVAGAIPTAGEHPSIVEALPSDGLDRSSVRYLHSHQILNSHLWLGEDDVFQLTDDTAAALGRYRRGDARAYLLVVDYPDAGRLASARGAFAAAFLGGSSEAGPVHSADEGWFAVASGGRRLAAVLAADSSGLAAALLSDTIEGGPHE